MKTDFAQLTRKYQVKILEEKEGLLIRKCYNIYQIDNIIPLLLLIGTLVALYAILSAGENIWSYVAALFLFVMSVVFIASIIKDFTDYVLVNAQKIVIRNSFIKRTIDVDPTVRLWVEKELSPVRRKGILVAEIWTYELCIRNRLIRTRILDFSADQKDGRECSYLIEQIKQMIKKRMQLER